jgi:organic hydroperoxide reductase OsmC/OhrA
MSGLSEYLVQKRQALLALRANSRAKGYPRSAVTARVTAEGRSGVRRIRLGDFQILSDSGYHYAGYHLGPSSAQLQLGVLGSCLTHIFLVKAAELEIPLDSLEVQVHGEIDPRGGEPEFPDAVVEPQNITYEVLVAAPSASDADLERLHKEAQQASLILNLLRNPQEVTGTVRNTAEPAGTVPADA